MEQTRSLFCTCDSVGTAPVSLLANEFVVRSVLHGQVSLAAVNQLCVIHEVMNGFKNIKDCLEIIYDDKRMFMLKYSQILFLSCL